MKGGNIYSFRGRPVSVALALVVLVLFSTLLWTWETNPIANTFRSAQEWYHLPSDFHMELPIDSVGTTKPRKGVEKSLTPSRVNETKLHLGIKGAAAVDSIRPQSPAFSHKKDLKSSSRNEACDYANGKWVADSRRPLYSGFNCKQWLSSMWSCRMTPRPDFSFEGYRWQPKNCDMQEFDRSKFLRKMKDKTIAFIGDSLGRQQFQSLMCMATGGEDSPEVENVGWEYGLVKHRGAIRPDGWAYRFPKTNTTILYYWTPLEPWEAQRKQLKVFFRTLSPRHFFNGDWNTGGSCDNTIPLSNGSEVSQKGSSDPVIEAALKGTKIKILDITPLSQLRDEAHMSRYTLRGTVNASDCLHWCLPGIPDTWNELLVTQL
ncbi:unnamed protein product [Vicia faba]|uniref:Trichome birefringence-like N-terminal domain-containing protein n=1 Tax=Vicia faba TaxID=3906 RepID=A0AAV1BC88_VICFA|nr:unnamed protein product [Vicia faba]